MSVPVEVSFCMCMYVCYKSTLDSKMVHIVRCINLLKVPAKSGRATYVEQIQALYMMKLTKTPDY